jgi:NAD(P)-dependent dehydrogenase (short-subunit alcohol dehydrogenase family)
VLIGEACQLRLIAAGEAADATRWDKNATVANTYGFEGRVALVTGGASGIGAATVERLEAGGATVHVFDLAAGEDVRDSAQLDAAVDRLPRLDVLVCAAGVAGDSLHTEDVSNEEWTRVLEINLNGVFYANRAAARKMKAAGYGRIVNIASIAGKEGNPMAAAYSASKAAVIGLTKSIGKDLAGSGVLVNCIAPAVIETPLLGQSSEEHIAYMTSRIPLARLGQPEEVASLICWLASDEMTFSTGACFDISGGRATY